jgi:transcriptional regulator with XRE-family HTH domain
MTRTPLAIILEQRGISQAELRIMTGLARQTVTEAYYGRRVSLETVLRIAEALDVPPKVLDPVAAQKYKIVGR